MPPKKKPDALAQPQNLLRKPRTEVRDKLAERAQLGTRIAGAQIASETALQQAKDEYYKWDDYNKHYLETVFSTNTLSFEYGRVNAYSFGGADNFADKVTCLKTDIRRSVREIESIIERLDLIPEDSSLSPHQPQTSTVESEAARSRTKVFVVHGHDNEAKQEVARLLTDLGLEPIILQEQADQGKTIIEKFEHHADVAFAVVLLTPDDVGGTKAEVTTAADTMKALKPRARQNVILELGYFQAKLGRGNVCPLKKGNVDLPSDILGVVYKEMDGHGAWKFRLGQELLAAGFEIDLSKIKL